MHASARCEPSSDPRNVPVASASDEARSMCATRRSPGRMAGRAEPREPRTQTVDRPAAIPRWYTTRAQDRDSCTNRSGGVGLAAVEDPLDDTPGAARDAAVVVPQRRLRTAEIAEHPCEAQRFHGVLRQRLALAPREQEPVVARA